MLSKYILYCFKIRWKSKFALDRVPTYVIAVYRDQLDRLRDDEVCLLSAYIYYSYIT